MSANGLKDYYLIRCYEKPEYREGFNNGSNIHISHMNYFFHLESDFQRDAEGLVFQQPPNTKGIFFNAPKDMKERLLRDGIFVESNGQISIADSISKEDFVKYFLENAIPTAITESFECSIGGYICCFYLISKSDVVFLENEFRFRTDKDRDDFYCFLQRYTEKKEVAYVSAYDAYEFVNKFCDGMTKKGFQISFSPVTYKTASAAERIKWFQSQKIDKLVFTKDKKFEYQKEFRIFLIKPEQSSSSYIEESGIDFNDTIVNEFVYLSPEYAKKVMGNKHEI